MPLLLAALLLMAAGTSGPGLLAQSSWVIRPDKEEPSQPSQPSQPKQEKKEPQSGEKEQEPSSTPEETEAEETDISEEIEETEVDKPPRDAFPSPEPEENDPTATPEEPQSSPAPEPHSTPEPEPEIQPEPSPVKKAPETPAPSSPEPQKEKTSPPPPANSFRNDSGEGFSPPYHIYTGEADLLSEEPLLPKPLYKNLRPLPTLPAPPSSNGEPVEPSPISPSLTSGRLIIQAPTGGPDAFPDGPETPAPFQEPEPPPAYSLSQCIEIAINQNPSILRVLESIKELEGLVIEVRSEALPKLSLDGTFDTEDDHYTKSRMYGSFNQHYWTAGARITQLIFSGGKVKASLTAARLSRMKQYHDLNTTIDQTVLSVRKSYYDALLNQSLIEVRQDAIRLLEEELQDQKKRLRAGTVTRFNVLRAEVELANARPPLIRAENAYKLALVELARLMALDYDDPSSETPPFQLDGRLDYEPSDYELPYITTLALKNRPEIKAAERQVEIERQGLKANRADYSPKLEVYGGYDFQNDRSTLHLDEQFNGWVAGLKGSWDIFDGFLTKGRVIQSEARITAAMLAADEVRRQVFAEVREAYFKWQEAVQLIASQQKNVEQALESLRLANARYNVGVATQLDVLNAQVALTEARTNQISARYDYNLAVAELERVTSAPLRLSRHPGPTRMASVSSSP